MVFLEYRAARFLNVATPPALAVVGWLGNAMVVHVLACSSLRRTACFPYLAAIACLDCGVLLCNLLFNFIDVFVTALRTSHDVCRLHYFLFFVCSHLSAWLLVAVTAQRYFVVCRPLRAFRVTSLRCTCWVIGGLVAGCVGLNAHHLVIRAHVWNNETGRYTCQTLSTGSEIFTHAYWPWVDALAYCFVPSLLLIVFNTAIVRTLYRAAAFRNKYQFSFSNFQPSVQSQRFLRRNSLPANFLGTTYNHYQNHHRQHFLRSALSGSRTLVRGGARGQTLSQEVVCQTVKNQSRSRSSQHLKATSNKSWAQWNHSCYSLSLVSWISEVPESEFFIDSGRQPHLHQGRKQSVSLPHLHHTVGSAS
ncbi:trissin receptor-like [Pomacea canaliculata]|uniref:trissin receptor-like n=1 Tax=Pomacea canaliculata TaxID=400727 RepID=UPI000D725BC9|nr:trissin receptor-like [Pomacea canaliculata]